MLTRSQGYTDIDTDSDTDINTNIDTLLTDTVILGYTDQMR